MIENEIKIFMILSHFFIWIDFFEWKIVPNRRWKKSFFYKKWNGFFKKIVKKQCSFWFKIYKKFSKKCWTTASIICVKIMRKHYPRNECATIEKKNSLKSHLAFRHFFIWSVAHKRQFLQSKNCFIKRARVQVRRRYAALSK